MDAGPEFKTIAYAAEIAPVKEVSLLGTADLGYWTDRLTPHDLRPSVEGGRVLMLISAISSKFKGINFREATIPACVAKNPGHSARDGLYLVRAFVSVRFFAFIERAMFRTSYRHAKIEVECQPPASFRAVESPGSTLGVAMAMAMAKGRGPFRTGAENRHGPIFMPGRAPEDRRLFLARIEGEAEFSRYLSAIDSVTSKGLPEAESIACIRESGFAGREWILRQAGAHAKSKTNQRGAAGVFGP